MGVKVLSSSRRMAMARNMTTRMISMPPSVGVPALTAWDSGPSTRMALPKPRRCMRRM